MGLLASVDPSRLIELLITLHFILDLALDATGEVFQPVNLERYDQKLTELINSAQLFNDLVEFDF